MTSMGNIFFTTWIYNKRLLIRYSTRDTKIIRTRFVNYTLGKKYQIKENLRAFRFILFVLLTGCFFSIICLPVATISAQSNPFTQVFLRAIVDLFTTVSFVFSSLAGLYAHDEWRSKFMELLPLRRRRKETRSSEVHSSSPSNKNEIAEGEVYFNHLKSAWE
ncbi:sre-16 [Pristionchus pacificus]|nr:sre-16 [Pristionchus pacificus]